MEFGKYNSVIQIGKGACGSVYLVRSKDTKKVFALKRVQLDESRKTRTKEAVLREARIMSELKHPHIVMCHDSFFDSAGEHLCILLDYCDGGTLDDKIKTAAQKNQHLPEKQVIQWFLQLALAVRFMHSRKVLHRDLKTENVFLNKSGTLVKLGDFGIAKAMDQAIDVASTCVGTPCYLSPEMCQDIPYSSKADVWALGCMLYEMCALKPAFDAHNLVSLFYKIVQADFEPIPDSFSEDMQCLVNTILVKSAEERPSARGLLSVPFLRKELVKFIEDKEFILQQRRLPTRQGSRPYSTPAGRSDPSIITLKQDGNALPQRAFSCRPVLVVSKEKSLLKSAKPGQRSGRVSTIPEESEEQALERSLRLEKSQGQAQLILHLEKVESQKGEDLKLDLEDINKNCDETVNHNGVKSPKTSPKSESNRTPKAVVAPKDIERVRRDSGNGAKTPSPDTGRKSHKNEQLKLEGDCTQSPSVGRKSNVLQGKNLLDVDSNNVMPDSSRKTPKNGSVESEGTKKTLKKDRIKTPRDRSKTPSKKDNSKSPPVLDSPRKQKIQEPQRTPRILEPKPLQIQKETPKLDLQEKKADSSPKPLPSSTSSSATPAATVRKTSKKNRAAKTKSLEGSIQNQLTREKKHMLKRRDSAPGSLNGRRDSVEYYSDDFDNSSGSEIEEDIPEELPSKSRPTRTNSLTFEIDMDLPLEIPEIPEDLPDGREADDEDNDLDDDSEEIEEELDEVINMAREAQEDLDDQAQEDELIVDNSERAKYSASIKRHCMKALGKEKYESVKDYCENISEGPELKKLETVVGREHMKTVYLIREVSKMSLK